MKRFSCLLFSFLFWLLAQNLIGKYLLVNLQEELGQDNGKIAFIIKFKDIVQVSRSRRILVNIVFFALDTNSVKKTPFGGWKAGLDLVDPSLDQRGSGRRLLFFVNQDKMSR